MFRRTAARLAWSKRLIVPGQVNEWTEGACGLLAIGGLTIGSAYGAYTKTREIGFDGTKPLTDRNKSDIFLSVFGHGACGFLAGSFCAAMGPIASGTAIGFVGGIFCISWCGHKAAAMMNHREKEMEKQKEKEKEKEMEKKVQ